MKNLLDLSEKASSLLKTVVYEQISGFHDSLGFYCEHDNFDCKPFATNDVFELRDSGLVSCCGDERIFNQYGNKVSGVEFLNVNPKYFNELKEYFGFNEE